MVTEIVIGRDLDSNPPEGSRRGFKNKLGTSSQIEKGIARFSSLHSYRNQSLYREYSHLDKHTHCKSESH